ncbi:MAG TPA: hypothetical protein PK668_26555 [Myxococcota bacterium]|nr:hypothetical protein [Myxococcota bacterium]HRY97090.1 hypothetical protein [Myxococcota bacterium]
MEATELRPRPTSQPLWLRALLVPILLVALPACDEGSTTEDPCGGVNCTGHGACRVTSGVPGCLCDLGYHAEGLTCVEDGTTGPCFEVTCSGHGQCVEVGGAASCRCDAGYHPEGLSCVMDPVEPCDGVTCSGHGACQVEGGQATCVCDPGYHAQGLSCLADENPCEGVTCSGHGTCQAADGQAACGCDPGYHAEGLTCVQDPIDPCDGVGCSGHGQCVEVGGAASCQCDAGYHAEGLTCVEDVDPCEGVDCGPDGACVPDAGQPTCLCDQGYEAQGLTCVETLCHCRERTASPYRYCSFTQSCSVDSDCCPANIPAPLTCNGAYPYVYACRGGRCESLNCTQDSHCSAYASYLSSQGTVPYVSRGCVEVLDDCTGEAYYSYCDLRQGCQQAVDCCPAQMTDPYDCLFDYPYRFDCVAGACISTGCTTDGQCDDYFTASSAGNPAGFVNDGCLEAADPCTGAPVYSSCQVFPACSTASDCCPTPVPAGFTCLVDYPYLYECVDGRCKTGMCSSDGQCSAYYQQVSTSNPSYDVNLGCLTF